MPQKASQEEEKKQNLLTNRKFKKITSSPSLIIFLSTYSTQFIRAFKSFFSGGGTDGSRLIGKLEWKRARARCDIAEIDQIIERIIDREEER